MANALLAVTDGASLPEEAIVFRLAKVVPGFTEQTEFPASPKHFELSSEDRASERKLLSVYAESVTGYQEARRLFDDPLPRRLLYRLRVVEIRALRPDPDTGGIANLDVKWDTKYRMVDGEKAIDNAPGADGHCGIQGLYRPPQGSRAAYTNYVVQLFLLGKRNMVRLPDDPNAALADIPDLP